MLRSIKNITSYPVEALDGHIGTVKDCLFDDHFWTWRHLVVDTGNWLPGRKVLISPLHLQQPEVGMSVHHFPINLTKSQIEACPDLAADEPVSRRHETELASYYKHAPYWLVSDIFEPGRPERFDDFYDEHSVKQKLEHKEKLKEIEACHLQSAKEVFGYHIDAKENEFGYLDDLIVEDQTWKILFMVVAAHKWLPGRKFLIDIDWVFHFDWQNKSATVRLSREEIESSPVYGPHQPINHDYLGKLYDYYGLPQRKDKSSMGKTTF